MVMITSPAKQALKPSLLNYPVKPVSEVRLGRSPGGPVRTLSRAPNEFSVTYRNGKT